MNIIPIYKSYNTIFIFVMWGKNGEQNDVKKKEAAKRSHKVLDVCL